MRYWLPPGARAWLVAYEHAVLPEPVAARRQGAKRLQELQTGGTVARAAHRGGRRVGFESVPSATPSALTPVAVQLRTVGVRRAIPRRSQGARLAISATARSDRRIA